MKTNAINKIIDPIKRKISLAIARAVVKVVKDDKDIQRMQVSLLKDELRDSLERFQDYGISSWPKVGAEAIVAFLGGDRSHGVVLKVDDRRYRFKLTAEGEVAIYTDEGDSIHLKRGKKIEVTTNEFIVNAADKIEMNTKALSFTASESSNWDTGSGRAEFTGDVYSEEAENSLLETKTKFNIHKHPETGSITQGPDQTL